MKIPWAAEYFKRGHNPGLVAWMPLSRNALSSSELVGADRGVEKKLVAIKINYMHRNAR